MIIERMSAFGIVFSGSLVSSDSFTTLSKPIKAKKMSAAAENNPWKPLGISRYIPGFVVRPVKRWGRPIRIMNIKPPTSIRVNTTFSLVDSLIPIKFTKAILPTMRNAIRSFGPPKSAEKYPEKPIAMAVTEITVAESTSHPTKNAIFFPKA